MWSKETFAVDECGEVIKISESFLAHFKKKKFFLVMTHVELGGGGGNTLSFSRGDFCIVARVYSLVLGSL